MYRTAKRFTYSKALTDALLNTLTVDPAAPLLTTPKVQLFTDGPNPGPDNVVADFTEATFNGYAEVALTLAGPVQLMADDRAKIDSLEFIATAGGVIDDQVRGYILTDGANAYYGGELFAEPVPFGAVGDYLALDIILPLPARYTATV